MKKHVQLAFLWTMALVMLFSFNSWGQETWINEDIQDWDSQSGYDVYSQPIDVGDETGTVLMTACIVSPGGSASGTGSSGFVQMQGGNGILELPEVPSVSDIEFRISAFGDGRTIQLQKQDGDDWIDLDTFNADNAGLTNVYSLYLDEPVVLRIANPSAAVMVHDIIISKYEEPSQVLAPGFDPDGGEFFSPVDVTISTETSDATVFYSDESDDGPWNEVIGDVTLNETTTLWAYATADDLDDSDVASAEFVFPEVTEVASISELRDIATLGDNTIYQITGEVFLTYQNDSRNQKYFQDETTGGAGIKIDDPPGYLTTDLAVGDGVENITGTLSQFNRMLQFVPVEGAAPEAPISTGLEIQSMPVTLAELIDTDNFFDIDGDEFSVFQAVLIHVASLQFEEEGVFDDGANFGALPVSDPTASLDDIDDADKGTLFRVEYDDLEYNGDPIPENPVNLTAVVDQRFNDTRIFARSWDDIEVLPGQYLLSVTVTDAETEVPLEGTSVQFSVMPQIAETSWQYAGVTDEAGMVTFTLADNTYEGEITKEGYESEILNFIIDGEDLDLSFELTPEDDDLFDVTFNVDMTDAVEKQLFDHDVDFVDVAGSFNDWGDPVQELTRVGDTYTYTFTTDHMFEEGDNLEFKFRINADSWEPGENRHFVVTANENLYGTSFRTPSIGWANLQWPPDADIILGDADSQETLYAQIYIQDVTGSGHDHQAISVSAGINHEDTDPATWDDEDYWLPMVYDQVTGNNDQYMLQVDGEMLSDLSPGTYYYATRFQFGEDEYVYGGFDGGFWDGTDNVSGILTLLAPEPDIYTVTFEVEDEEGDAIDAATITLGEITNEQGDYVFDEMEPGTYSYTVTAENYLDEEGVITITDADVAETVVMTYSEPDIINTFPWVENFLDDWEGEPEAPEGWTVVNEASYWQQTDVHSFVGDYAARSYQGSGTGFKADEWLITPGINMDHPEANELIFMGKSHRAPDGVREHMRVLIMDEVYHHVDDLHDHAVLIDDIYLTDEWDEYIFDLEDYEGTKYLAFHYYIQPEDNPSFNWVYLDNVRVGDFDVWTLTMMDPVGQGSIIPEPGDHIFSEGSLVYVTAEADSAWYFDRWELNGDLYSDLADTSLVITADKDLQAFFELKDVYTLTMEEPDGLGTVTPEPGDHDYLDGDVAELSATPGMGYYFSHWTGNVDDPDAPETTILMDEDQTVKAVFEAIEGIELPFEEDFTGIAENEIPEGWSRDLDNWGVNDSNNAGGEAPEMRFHWSPSVDGSFYLTTPKIDTEGYSELLLSFKHYNSNFTSPGPYTLRVVAIADNQEYLIHEWVDPDDIPAEEVEFILTEANHGAGTDNFYLAWIFEGESYGLWWWDIDDIHLGEAPDMYEATFLVMEDTADETPIEGATIHVGGEHVTTDDNGMASIMLVDDQSYTADVTASGYVAEEVTFTVDGSDLTIEVLMMDDISAPGSPEITTEGLDFGEALFTWDTAELLHLYQHDGSIPAEPNAFYQEDDMVYGTVFDLGGYPDAEVSHIDFHHLQWGISDADYDYLVHIVDWANYDIIETKGPFTTVVNDDWEEDVMLSVDVAGYDQVGVLIQPQGYLPDDAYPCITADGTGPNGLSLQAPVDDLSNYTVNPPTVGDFFIDLYIYTTHAKDRIVQAEGFTADHVETVKTRRGEAVSSAETTLFTQYGALAGHTSKAFIGYNVFLNDDEVATEIEENEYLFTGLPEGDHTAGVQSVYTTGSSEVAEVDFTIGAPAQEVATLAELRDMPDDGTIYHYTGEAVIVAMDSWRNRKFLQDETAAIMIDDDPGVITPDYDLYDVITDVVGQISVFNDMVQFQPTQDTGEAIDNTPVDPVVFALDAVTPDDQAKLIQFNGVHFADIDEDEVFENGSDYTITDGDNEFVVRTDFWGVDYIGEPIPHNELTIAGVVLQYQETLQLVPRFDADIQEADEPDTFAVTFHVDLDLALAHGVLEGFDPDMHHILMTGEMFGWTEPDPAHEDMVLDWIDEDPMTYGITLHLEAGTYEYKYFSDLIGDGWEGGEWEGGDNRMVEVTGDMEVTDHFGFTDDEISVVDTEPVSMNIYPNPVQNTLYIETDVSITDVRIIDILGQVVYSTYVGDSSYEVNVAGFNTGIYFIKMNTDRGVIAKRFQVVQ